jgi:putative oxidoreductase
MSLRWVNTRKTGGIMMSGPSLLKSTADWAPLVIRIALGIIFIAHGSQKLFGAFGGHGMSGTVGMMQSLGVHPAVFFAWIVTLVEFLGGIGILIGLLTSIASLLIAIDMVVAIATVHGKNGFFLGQPPGYEYNIALIAMAVALILSGAGALSVDRLIGWKY